MPDDDELLTLDRAGALLGVSATTVWRRIRAGVLIATDVGTPDKPKLRVARRDLRAYQKASRVALLPTGRAA